jgi:hypothetical protein
MALSADDVAEIITLAHEFNRAVDAHEPAAWVQTWTADGELDGPLGTLRGHDALAEWISATVASLSHTRHCSVNEVVRGDGDHATMRSSYFVLKTESAPPSLFLSGSYDDELVREADGRWRFARRRHHIDPT